LSVEDCHRTIPPVWLVSVISVPLFEHIPPIPPPTRMPPLGTASTPTAASVEYVSAQAPLVTTARNRVLVVRFPVTSGLSVEASSIGRRPGVTRASCHRANPPLWLVSMISARCWEQTTARSPPPCHPLALSRTATAASVEYASPQTPLVTTARKRVLTAKFARYQRVGRRREVVSRHPVSAEACHLTIPPTWPAQADSRSVPAAKPASWPRWPCRRRWPHPL